MSTLTTADALLNVAKGMTNALEGGMPQGYDTKEALEKLMEIFKESAACYKEEESAMQERQVVEIGQPNRGCALVGTWCKNRACKRK